jgi:hypothetical protein
MATLSASIGQKNKIQMNIKRRNFISGSIASLLIGAAGKSVFAANSEPNNENTSEFDIPDELNPQGVNSTGDLKKVPLFFDIQVGLSRSFLVFYVLKFLS